MLQKNMLVLFLFQSLFSSDESVKRIYEYVPVDKAVMQEIHIKNMGAEPLRVWIQKQVNYTSFSTTTYSVKQIIDVNTVGIITNYHCSRKHHYDIHVPCVINNISHKLYFCFISQPKYVEELDLR